MQTETTKATPDTAETGQASQSVPSTDHQEVEQLTNELKRLLVKHESTLDEQGVRQEVEVLERWMESYRRGLSAARKISETGTSMLHDLKNHLKLAIDERQRLEGEGGNPPTKEEAAKIDDLLKATRRIENILPNIEQVFHTADGTKESV